MWGRSGTGSRSTTGQLLASLPHTLQGCGCPPAPGHGARPLHDVRVLPAGCALLPELLRAIFVARSHRCSWVHGEDAPGVLQQAVLF